MPDEVQRLRHWLFSALELLGSQKVLLPGFAVAFATPVSSSPSSSSPVDGVWLAPSSLLPVIRRSTSGRRSFPGQGRSRKLASGGVDLRIDHWDTGGFRMPVTSNRFQQRNKSKPPLPSRSGRTKPCFTCFSNICKYLSLSD